MQLGHIEIFVKDVATARAFYVDVLGCTHHHPEMEHVAWLTLGEVTLLLRPGAPPPACATYAESRLGVTLYTDGLDATMAALTARGLVFRGTDGSERCPTFQDPDGNWFQLVDPAEMS